MEYFCEVAGDHQVGAGAAQWEYPAEHIPAEAQDRSRLFSSVMAAYAKEGRPVLVVVDNASSSTQVRPLLPAGGKAVITSRHTLADLEACPLE